MKTTPTFLQRSLHLFGVLLLNCCVAALSACGGGAGSSGGGEGLTVGGTVSNLSGGQLSLVNNGNTANPVLVSADGAFTFFVLVPSGGSYNVTVATQPAGQVCTVQNGQGSHITAAISNVQVICSSAASAVTVGGTVTGLASGSSLQLINNHDAAKAVTVSGGSGAMAFTFTQPIAMGSGYGVTLAAQSGGQFCSVSNAYGMGGLTNISNINIQCVAGSGTITGPGSSGGSTDPSVPGGPGTGGAGGNGNGTTTFNIGGVISGLNGTLMLVNNGDVANPLMATANGGFTFGVPVVTGSTYAVTIGSQPAGQVCSVGNASGVVGVANVGNVSVVCASSAAGSSFTVGGSITGVASGDSLTLRNGADTLTVVASANPASFTMGERVPLNGSYALAVANSPSGKLCSLTRGSGVGVVAQVSNVAVTCSRTTPAPGANLLTANTTVTVGGTLSGLVGQVTLVNNNDTSTALTLSANGSFTFAAPVPAGSTYAVSVAAQPAGQVCTVFNPNTNPILVNVTNISVVCSVPYYSVGGTVTGLLGGGQITLVNNGDVSQPLAVATNGSFTLPQPVAAGAGYRVSVLTQQSDNSQICAVDSGLGLNIAANVSNVAVNCTPTVPADLANAAISQKFALTHTFSAVSASAPFSNTDGKAPLDFPPIAAADGLVYGMTASGGANGTGEVFKVAMTGPSTATVSSVYDFSASGATDGGRPTQNLVLGNDGALYGLAGIGVGGVTTQATFYKISAAGVFSVIPQTGGATVAASNIAPIQKMALGLDSNFYGCTNAGGANNKGFLFRLTPDGVITKLLDLPAGISPGFTSACSALSLASDGNFYGTLCGTPASPAGVVFQLTPGGAFNVIYSFGTVVPGSGNPVAAVGGVTQGSDGYLYGSSAGGGTNDTGTLFKLLP